MARFIQFETTNDKRYTVNLEAVVYCRPHDTQPDVTVIVLQSTGAVDALMAYDDMAALLAGDEGARPATRQAAAPEPLRRLASV